METTLFQSESPHTSTCTQPNSFYSAGTFQLSYTAKHTRLFIDQVHNNTISGFTPNSNSPDPNWGKCLQCAAVDRARMKLSPAVARSDICNQCFKQYCYDPNNLTSSSALSNRKLVFVDPNGAVQDFFEKHTALILGLSIGLGLLLIIGTVIGWFVLSTLAKILG